MSSSPFPKPTPEELDSFFGKIQLGEDGYPRETWENNFLVKKLLPYPMFLAWEPDHRINKVRCHREVAHSLLHCLESILKHYNGDRKAIHNAGLDLFGGCYAYRCTRGTHVLSMHAYGAAFDFCLPPGKEMPAEVVEIFTANGWAWGGDRKSNKEISHYEAINRK